MNQNKSTQKSSQKKNGADTENLMLAGKVLGGLAVVCSIAFGGYKLLHRPPAPVWTNYDELLSTGEKILHEQTVSIKNISSDDSLTNNANDPMYLSVKKIDNLDSVWFISANNDFGCISTNSKKCTLDISFDGGRPQHFTYDGGAMKTAYIINSTELIFEIKRAKEIKLASSFKRVEMSPTEKSQIALKNNGYSETYTKEHTFNVTGLNWQ